MPFVIKKEGHRVGEMAQCPGAFVPPRLIPKFDPWDPHDRRGELTLVSCSLTSI